MSRRKSRAQTPEQQAEERRQIAIRKRDVEELKSRGLDVRHDAKFNIIVAQRLDVFSLLHSRKALTDTQLYAVRRLEEKHAVAHGHLRPEQTLDRVQSTCEGAPGQNVTQSMIDAHRELVALYRETGHKNAILLNALIAGDGSKSMTRWRDTVQRVTGETNDRSQNAVIRLACDNLALAWQALDYRARERKEKAA